MPDIEKQREQSRLRVKRLDGRQRALGRVRRGYYATPAEHTELVTRLDELRAHIRVGDVLIADPDDVLPEYRGSQ